jgi:hypothetical protein
MVSFASVVSEALPAGTRSLSSNPKAESPASASSLSSIPTLYSIRSRSSCLWQGLIRAPRHPEPMQEHGELTSQRNNRFAFADPLG